MIVYIVTWVLATACIVSVAYDWLARRRVAQPVTPVVSPEAIEERIQQAFDNGYFSGFEDCRAGFGMSPDVVGRSGLIDTMIYEFTYTFASGRTESSEIDKSRLDNEIQFANQEKGALHKEGEDYIVDFSYKPAE